MNSNLLDKTLELTRNSNIPITRLCREISVSPEWYHKLVSGKIRDPGVRRIQRLHDYLLARAPAEQSDEQPADEQPREATAA